jgi:hypothetical protein
MGVIMERSQNCFSLRCQRGTLFHGVLHLQWAMWLALVFAPCSMAQNTDAFARELRGNVVRIQVTEPGCDENGFGFITGERNGEIYIATARHLFVSEQNVPGACQPEGATVSFFSDQGRRYEAALLDVNDEALDLAVLVMTPPQNLDWQPQSEGTSDQYVRGTDVWYVGRQQAWFVPVRSGTINEEQSGQATLLVEGLDILEGTSGAPLISGAGIIGMIQRSSAGMIRATKLDYIKGAFERWNYPWNLTPAQAPEQAPEQECAFSISSSPSDADIYLEGAYLGTTPSTTSMQRGRTFSVLIEKYGYESYIDNVSCEVGSLNASLTSVPADELSDLNTEPATDSNISDLLTRIFRQPQDAETGAIFLRYTGDAENCVLEVGVQIGYAPYIPTSNFFEATDAPLGLQNYEISGVISCPLSGYCSVTGTGEIDVVAGQIYDLQWRNVAFASCSAELL